VLEPAIIEEPVLETAIIEEPVQEPAIIEEPVLETNDIELNLRTEAEKVIESIVETALEKIEMLFAD
jgi:hypothetical protein